MAVILEAPIVAVTVYPSQARVTRRGRTRVEAGVTEVVIPALPLTLLEDSVRVNGRGTGARILGVDVARRFHADAPDSRVQELDSHLRELRGRRQALVDDDATEAALVGFLNALAKRAGARFAIALAQRESDPDGVASFATTITVQLRAVHERQRQLAEGRELVEREIAAVEQELATLHQQRKTERRDVLVTIEADASAGIELNVAYVVTEARWTPVYDVRLEGDHVIITWHGLVTQRSGEDWPAAELALSTARPAVTTAVPELDPWYIGEYHPPIPTLRREMTGVAPARAMAEAPAGAAAETFEPQAAPMQEPSATAEHGATAVTYRLARPVAVPSDGAPHKATVTAIEFDAVLGYLSVPKLAEEAYLRATITNSSPHALLPGKVSVFHGADFVGTTSIDAVPPDGEVEFQLGVDDRVKIERELIRRETSKNLLGGQRKTTVMYRITVENHLRNPARLTVKDQFPISRHESVKIRDEETKPAPAETSDMGELTWHMELEAGTTQHIDLGFTLEHPRGMQLSGWTD